MDAIFRFIEELNITPMIGASYSFTDIAEALYDMDHHKVNGKIVVTV